MTNTINPVATVGHVRKVSVQNRALPAGGMYLGPLHFEIGPEQFSIDGGGYVWSPDASSVCRKG